jgi:NAD(P)-dependent dehydrogenase (short-subunit alcohol dehydrogenase family)
MSSRSILITGASTGIGEACALRFDALGWQVFAGVRSDADGTSLADKATSGRLRPVTIDVTDLAVVERATAEIDAHVGPDGLQAVVNNAGIALGGPIEYLALDQWRRQLEVNVIGQIAVTKAVLPALRVSSSGGRIIFIGSIAGRMSSPFIAPYAASKHAIEAIAESLRHELADTATRTVVIEPGAVRTPIWSKGMSAADETEATLPPEGLARYGEQVGRLRRAMGYQASCGVDPPVVAKVVERAVTSPKPAARYLVGRDAKLMGSVDRLLPDRARDAFQRAAAKLISR